jgi:Flp pilus assembly protein TadD
MAKTHAAAKSAEKVTANPKGKGSLPQEATQTAKTNILLTFFEQLDSSRIILLIALVCCLAYANSLGGDFVFDDTDQIVENKDIHSWDNLGRAFTTHVWAFRERPEALRVPIPPPYYRPLFTILFTVEYKLFGLWPQGWHLVSLLLHILCSVGVYYVLLLLAQRKSVAVIASLLFAVYSIHVESVSWISGVTDPLFGVFFLASFYFYLRHRAEQKRSLFILSLIMFGLSTLSKETALSLVGLVFCAELIETASEKSATVSNKEAAGFAAKLLKAGWATLPYFGVAILYLIPRYLVIGGIAWDNPHTYHGPFINVLLTLPWAICTYFLHLLWPVNLSITYFTSFETSLVSARFLLPTLALLAAAGLLFTYRKKLSKEVWYALALILIPLLPVLDLRKLSIEYLIFDRYLYLSVAGWTWLLALGLCKLAEREEYRAGKQTGQVSALQRLGLSSAIAVVAIVLLIAATARENSAWANAHSLWSQASRIRPNFWVTHYNAGLALYDAKRYAEARDALTKAAQIAPNEPSIFNALGQAYTALGENSRAIENFKRSFEIDPEMFEAINNLGTIYFTSGDYKSAEQYFKSALALRPQATVFHYNLGLCYSRQNRYAEAVPELEKALQYAQNDVGVLYELALVYEKVGRKEEAVKTLQRGLSLNESPEISGKLTEALNRLSKN